MNSSQSEERPQTKEERINDLEQVNIEILSHTAYIEEAEELLRPFIKEFKDASMYVQLRNKIIDSIREAHSTSRYVVPHFQ